MAGLTLPELLLAMAVASLLMAGLSGLVGNALTATAQTTIDNATHRQAAFALQRMVTYAGTAERLMLPLADNPRTDWRENVREQTYPESSPEGSSLRASAVLAIALGAGVDRDGDGWSDANNDRDFQDLDQNGSRSANEPERINEDWPEDMSNDLAPGIVGIDDDGDGRVDESDADFTERDDDEEGIRDEEHVSGVDRDGDGSADEDMASDRNKDGAPGVLGVDDDGDGAVDEGHKNDDDEDGQFGEDWLDPVVFYLVGSQLIERQPANVDINGDGLVTGADYTESVIAEGVTRFRVERLFTPGSRWPVVSLTLEITDAAGTPVVLSAAVRVGRP